MTQTQTPSVEEIQPPYDPKHVYDVPMNLILAKDSWNCRGPIDDSSVFELAKSLRTDGLMQPIIIQPLEPPEKGKRFRVIAGFRRFKATQFNREETIAALIKEGLTELDARLLNLSENIQRENLNIKQEALALEWFVEAHWTRKEIAQKLGKSEGWVQPRLYLLDLPPEIQDDAAAGFLTMSQIRECWSLPSRELQFEFVRKVKDKMIRGLKREPLAKDIKPRNEKRERTASEILAMQEMIRETFGNSITTRMMAWSAGEITDYEAHKSLADYGREVGVFYVVPPGLEPLAGLDLIPPSMRTGLAAPVLEPLSEEDEQEDFEALEQLEREQRGNSEGNGTEAQNGSEDAGRSDGQARDQKQSV